MSGGSLLRHCKMAEIGRRLIATDGHQLVVGTDEIFFLADANVKIRLVAAVLGPVRDALAHYDAIDGG